MNFITQIAMYSGPKISNFGELDHSRLREVETKESIISSGLYASELVIKRLNDGWKCYAYYENEVPVSFAWVRRGADHFIGELNKVIHYDHEVIHIVDCYTPLEYRGRGYYSNLIKLIAHKYSSNVFIYANQNNIASSKGIEKAGFELYCVYSKLPFGIIESNKRKKMKVCVLPKYGIENPYQFLQISGLKEKGIDAFFGDNYRAFGIVYNYYKYRPDWIYFDWIYTLYSINLPTAVKWIFYWLFKFQIMYLKLFTNCKLAYTVHNFERHEVYHKKIDEAALKFIVERSDVVRFFSQACMDKFRDKYHIRNIKSFKVLPEGSYVNYYKNEITSEEARKILGIDKERKVFLHLGSIRPYKGIEDLVHSFFKYKKENWMLIIAGYPYSIDYANGIREIVNDDAQIILNFEHIHADRLQIFFNAADIVVLPFKRVENSGSLILAMGFRKAVIAPVRGVIATRLNHQRQLLFKTDIDEILSKIEDISDLDKVGMENYEQVERYHWSDTAILFE
jgi:beta-1,4-mannosyltransferase